MTTEVQEFGAVVYTDGSCRFSNPGFVGWGAHGYLYEINDKTVQTLAEAHILTTRGYVPFQDFARMSEARRPKLVTPVKYLDFFESSLTQASNNVAELNALCSTLEFLKHQEIQQLNTITIFTDSEYVRRGLMEWCATWVKHKWMKADGTPVTNCEWWIRIYDLYLEFKNKGLKVTVEWVKAHNEVFGNTHADILAGISSNYSMDRILKSERRVNDPKGYWKQDIDRHPFLNFRRLYFNSVDKYNITGRYFQGDNGGQDVFDGKRIPETGYGLIRLKEPVEIIEEIKQSQFKVANGQNAIIMLKLDRVYSKDVYPYLVEHGKYCLQGSGSNLNLNFMDKKPVCIEVNPTGLSMRTIGAFNFLEEILDEFIAYKQTGFAQRSTPKMMNVHDITSYFYNREPRKNKKEGDEKLVLKPELGVGFRDMAIDIKEINQDKEHELKVPLILGLDLLPRNNLKRLEDENPTIHLVTWRESETALRYATVIECDLGIGIWSNFFSDTIFFR